MASRAIDGLSSVRVTGSCSKSPDYYEHAWLRYELIMERLSKMLITSESTIIPESARHAKRFSRSRGFVR